jgi:hypothetical protein
VRVLNCGPERTNPGGRPTEPSPTPRRRGRRASSQSAAGRASRASSWRAKDESDGSTGSPIRATCVLLTGVRGGQAGRDVLEVKQEVGWASEAAARRQPSCVLVGLRACADPMRTEPRPPLVPQANESSSRMALVSRHSALGRSGPYAMSVESMSSQMTSAALIVATAARWHQDHLDTVWRPEATGETQNGRASARRCMVELAPKPGRLPGVGSVTHRDYRGNRGPAAAAWE